MVLACYLKGQDFDTVGLTMKKQNMTILIVDDDRSLSEIMMNMLEFEGYRCNIAGTGKIMEFFAEKISTNTYMNVMDQYRPCGNAHQDEFINRRLTAREYRDALKAAKKAGITRLDSKERIPVILGFK